MQGGVGDYTRELALALAETGCQVEVLTSRKAGPALPLTVHPLIGRWNWSCWPVVRELVRRRQPDLVHIQYQAAAYAMHPAVNLLPWRLRQLGAERPRVAVTFHDLRVPYLFPKAGPLRRWVIDELARRSELAITTNRKDWEELGARVRTQPALIPIGSNIALRLPAGYDREAWRSRWGAGAGDLLLSFFGFVNDRKGVDTLLRALHLLRGDSAQPAGPRLVMIGGQTGASDPTNQDTLARIEALIAQLGLADRVRWTGYLPSEEVSATFLAADLCVLPYRDGASLLHGTLHAALAHGVPIVTTTPHPAVLELVDRQNVYLVPADDPQALAEALSCLAADRDLRRALAAGALALSEQFRWDRIAATTLARYQELVGAGSPRASARA